ncbi:hypothetical protein Tco_0270804 [Tanacetum coccineum]
MVVDEGEPAGSTALGAATTNGSREIARGEGMKYSSNNGAIYRTEVCACVIYPNKVVSEPDYDKQRQEKVQGRKCLVYCDRYSKSLIHLLEESKGLPLWAKLRSGLLISEWVLSLLRFSWNEEPSRDVHQVVMKEKLRFCASSTWPAE